MIACLDVHYFSDHARAAAVVARDWTSSKAVSEATTSLPAAADYQPGEFYKRELEPLLAVIAKLEPPIDTFVIDGYCHLSADSTPGLGAHLHKALGSNPQIVGVAKNRFRETRHAVEVLRGGSQRPLFVTAIGMAYEQAAQHVESMAGQYRFPTLLKAVDRLARGGTGAGNR